MHNENCILTHNFSPTVLFVVDEKNRRISTQSGSPTPDPPPGQFSLYSSLNVNEVKDERRNHQIII